MEAFYDEELLERQAVKTATLLAKAAYDERYSNFVKGRPERLAFIDEKLVALAHEFAFQQSADPERVILSLRDVIAAETEEDEEEEETDEDEKKKKDEKDSDDRDDYTDEERDEGTLKPKKKDYGFSADDKEARVVHAYTEVGNAADETTWNSCFRCEMPLNPVQASMSPVCVICTDMIVNNKTARKALEIVSLVDGSVTETIPLQHDDESYIERVTLGLLTNMNRDAFFVREVDLPDLPQPDQMMGDQPAPQPEMEEQGGGVDPVAPVSPVQTQEGDPQNLSSVEAAMPVNPNEEAKCDWCPFTGTLPVVQLHEQQVHQNELRQQQQGEQQSLMQNAGQPPLAPMNMSYGALPTTQVPDKEILREPGHQANPSDAFEDRVQTMANNQAAAAWSVPSKDDIQQIAQQYGLDPGEVQQSLIIVATFGDATAVNGSEGTPSPPLDQLQQLQHFGGQVPTSEEEVDVPTAIQATAHELGLNEGDIQTSLFDSYGGDLGSKYFISVAGTAAYYLPKQMVGDQEPAVTQPPQTPTQPPEQVGTGPQKLQAKVIRTFASLEEALEWESQSGSDQ